MVIGINKIILDKILKIFMFLFLDCTPIISETSRPKSINKYKDIGIHRVKLDPLTKRKTAIEAKNKNNVKIMDINSFLFFWFKFSPPLLIDYKILVEKRPIYGNEILCKLNKI